MLFPNISILDAGSDIPDLIRGRLDGQNPIAFLNFDIVFEVKQQVAEMEAGLKHEGSKNG